MDRIAETRGLSPLQLRSVTFLAQITVLLQPAISGLWADVGSHFRSAISALWAAISGLQFRPCGQPPQDCTSAYFAASLEQLI